MHQLLEKIFKKRGIKSFNDLDNEPNSDGSPNERQTFENWNKILSKDELTTADIKEFCSSQISVIEGKWKDLTVSNEKKAELIPYHTVYKALLVAIDAPKVAREQLQKQLEQYTI